jgi:hypothetical protein
MPAETARWPIVHKVWNGDPHGGQPAGADAYVSHSTDLFMPHLAFPTAASASQLVTVMDGGGPASLRYYLRHSGVNTAHYCGRFLNAVLRNKVMPTGDTRRGYDVYVITSTGDILLGGVYVTPTEWVRVEFNSTGNTNVRVRIWKLNSDRSETLALDVTSNSMTPRDGANVGANLVTAVGTSSGNLRVANVLTTITSADIGPVPHLPPRSSEVTATGTTEVYTSKQATATGTTGMRLAGIYETRPTSVRYYDTSATKTAVETATNLTELTSAMAGVLAPHRMTLTIEMGDTQPFTGYTMTGTTFGHPKLKPYLKSLTDVLAMFPRDSLRYAQGTSLHIGNQIHTTSTPSTRYSGLAGGDGGKVALAVELNESLQTSVSADENVARNVIILHELGHVVHSYAKSLGSAAEGVLASAFTAANPPGFTYSPDHIGGPFTGEHPAGFTRTYAMSSMAEDVAEVFAYALAPGKAADLARWCQTDRALQVKVTALKRFLRLRWFGPYFIEEANGHVPQVRPL